MGGRQYAPGDAGIDLLYLDQYGGDLPPADTELRFRLMDRQRTIPLDDKAEMACLLEQAGITSPAVYFMLDEVPRERERLWFIKQPRSTSGKGISLATTRNLDVVYEPGCIIQEAISDVALIDGRKFTLRVYVLVHRGRVHLYDGGIVILHGAPYAVDSLDPGAQYSHDGYMDRDSAIRMLSLEELPWARTVVTSLETYLTTVFQAFADLLRFEAADRYCVFGLDLLLRGNFDPVLIEVNDRPNFVHTANINRQVNIPMVASLYRVLAQIEDPPEEVSERLTARYRQICDLGSDP